MNPELQRHAVVSWFESYLRVCNRHTFDELDHFLAADLTVNGTTTTRAGYVAELRSLARGFPDYRWTMQQLVINEGWLAVHLLGTGTHLGTFAGLRATGRRVRSEEYAWYRLQDSAIVELRDSYERAGLLEQIRPRYR